MSIRKECLRIQKKLLKMTKKLFGHKTFKESYDLMNSLRTEMEIHTNKRIDDFDNDDIHECYHDYAMYKTLEKFVNLYTDFTIFGYELEDRYGC